MCGRGPGRPARQDRESRRSEARDETDRIEAERFFSREKRTCGAALLVTRLVETTLASLALSVFVANLFGIPVTGFFCALFPGAAGRPRKVAFDRVFRYHGLTRRHRRNAHGIGYGAKRMAGEAVHSPGKVCTWLKEDTLISRH